MKKQAIYRQGDVIMIAVKSMPNDTTPIARESGRIILAHGELTGHAHAIADEQAEFFATKAGQQFLRITGATAELRHEEHTAVKLPAGVYRVARQVEYSPQALRNVAD